MKIVVFDLDETLGYFVELGIFWDCLNHYLYENDMDELKQENFNTILDLYPEFLRPGIIPILNYLKHKKTSKCCHKMMIYTNNQGPKKWADQLISYFEKKINYKLFDQLILAFKINGKKIEICRTSHDKSYKDLIKCTKLPLHAEICFLDDSYFPEMANDNVYYINVKPYTYQLKYEEMIERFLTTKLGVELSTKDHQFKSTLLNYLYDYHFDYIHKIESEYDLDKIVSKKILLHLEEFFNKKPKKSKSTKTKNNKHQYKNKTIKNKN